MPLPAGEAPVAVRGERRFVGRIGRSPQALQPTEVMESTNGQPYELALVAQGRLEGHALRLCVLRDPAAGEVEIAVAAPGLHFREVSAVVPESPRYFHARGVLRRLELSDVETWISRQVLREFLAALFRPPTFSARFPLADMLTAAREYEKHLERVSSAATQENTCTEYEKGIDLDHTPPAAWAEAPRDGRQLHSFFFCPAIEQSPTLSRLTNGGSEPPNSRSKQVLESICLALGPEWEHGTAVRSPGGVP